MKKQEMHVGVLGGFVEWMFGGVEEATGGLATTVTLSSEE